MKKRNVHTLIYGNLEKLTGGLEKFMASKGYLKLTSNGFMPLVIEKIGNNKISMTHYYKLNGDLVPDPDITVRIYPDQKMAEALSYQDTYKYQEVYPEENKVSLILKKELNTFLNQWLLVLKKQGFYS